MHSVAEIAAPLGDRRLVSAQASATSWAFVPVAVGTALRFGYAALAPLSPQWDGTIYVRGAELIASGHAYSQRILDPNAPDVPTAFYPVGFPAVLALVRMLGGSLRADLTLQALASSATLVLLASLARRLVGPRLAIRATWIHALAPGAVMLCGTWLAEPLVTLGSMLALHVALRHSIRAPIGGAVASGAILGVTAYLRATPLLVAPLLAFGVAWPRTRSVRRSVALAVIATAAAIVPLAPWAARNARDLGAPVLVSTNGGVNLLIGTIGDGSYQDVRRPARCGPTDGEVVLDRCRGEVAMQRIAHHPLAWLVRGISKTWHTFGHESAPAQHLAIANRASGDRRLDASLLLGLGRAHWSIMLAFAIVGIVMRATRPFGRAHAILFAPILGLAALHFVYLGGDRYHAPVAPLLAILAAEATASIGVRRPRGDRLRNEAVP